MANFWGSTPLLDSDFDDDDFGVLDFVRCKGSIGGGPIGSPSHIMAVEAIERARKKEADRQAAKRAEAARVADAAREALDRAVEDHERFVAELFARAEREVKAKILTGESFVCELYRKGKPVGALYRVGSQLNPRFDAGVLKGNDLLDRQTKRLFNKLATVKEILGVHGIEVLEAKKPKDARK